MKNYKIIECYDKYAQTFQKMAEPIFAAWLRMYVFCDMFRSGWLKVIDVMNGDWNRVVYLFEYEYKVPLISPSIAAIMGMFNEVVVATFLLIGLLTRFSALALLLMAIMIEFTYMHHLQHQIWITMLGYLVIRGGGMISIDHLIKKKMKRV